MLSTHPFLVTGVVNTDLVDCYASEVKPRRIASKQMLKFVRGAVC